MGSISASGIASAVRTRGWAASTAALLALAAAPALAFEGTEVDIRVQGLRNTNGIIRLCLTRNPAHFPNCDGDPAAVKRSVPAGQAGLIRLGGIPAGAYALAVIHDENGNGRLDRMLAIPREGFGFSRNPRIRMGPPSYDEVRFNVGGGRVEQTVTMKYLL